MDPIEVFQFCPRCGFKLADAKANKVSCENCGLIHYVNPIPCTSLILLNGKGELLLVKRKNAPGKGKWDLTGGFIELKESAEEGMVRETKEELGISLRQEDLTFFESKTDLYLYNGVQDNVIIFAYIAYLPADAIIRADDDASEAKFFAYDKIPWKDLAFLNVELFLKHFLEKQRV